MGGTKEAMATLGYPETGASRNSKAGLRTRLSQTGAKLTLDLFERKCAEVKE